jgi:hypothetical protein
VLYPVNVHRAPEVTLDMVMQLLNRVAIGKAV